MIQNKHIGPALALLRAEHNLTQLQLATRIDLDVKVISQLERGVNDPRLGLMEKLAQGFGMPLWELLRFVDRVADVYETRAEDEPLLPKQNWRAA
jgi:transcriptional regulator with XRE-family HTH domain